MAPFGNGLIGAFGKGLIGEWPNRQWADRATGRLRSVWTIANRVTCRLPITHYPIKPLPDYRLPIDRLPITPSADCRLAIADVDCRLPMCLPLPIADSDIADSDVSITQNVECRAACG
jgi:hypothetical protein